MDDKYQVKMSAYQEGEKVVIKVTLDDAQLVMKYEDKNSMSVLAENLEKILEYMWTDYLVRKEFNEQLENELDDWLDNI
jgi:hypothetical protein